MLRAKELAADLRGKLAGAVGSYNALSMSYPDPEAVERRFLARLGLEPSEHSTQLVEPEHALRLLLELNAAFGVIANLADDLRNLQRTEIGEVRESFAQGQVGSSTMPQKRNPWNSEHVKSLWKAFSPAGRHFLHGPDLRAPEGPHQFRERAIRPRVLRRPRRPRRTDAGRAPRPDVNRERMAANLGMTGGAVLAEPAYILLAESGEADAHEKMRRITLLCEKDGLSLRQALEREGAIGPITERLESLGMRDAGSFFEEPWRYRGRAAEKARAIGEKYRGLMGPIVEGS